MAKQYAFKKKERLSNANQIELLFGSENSFSIQPLRVLYQVYTDAHPVPVKVLIIVSKKKFKKAVDRNRIRRKIKEAYRLNKEVLYNEATRLKCSLILGIVYIGEDDSPNYTAIESTLVKCLAKLCKLINDSLC